MAIYVLMMTNQLRQFLRFFVLYGGKSGSPNRGLVCRSCAQILSSELWSRRVAGPFIPARQARLSRIPGTRSELTDSSRTAAIAISIP